MSSLETYIDVGKAPLTAPLADVASLKELPEYDRVATEIAKIGSLQGGAGTVAWPVVADNAAMIIRQYAKDIPAATYFSVALCETDGLQGLRVGWRVLFELLDTWWEVATPPIKRLRARVNSIDWWHERVKAFLNKAHEPIEQALQEELLQLAKDFDSLVGDRLEDCQPFYDIRESVQRLAVIAPAPSPEPDVALEVVEHAPGSATESSEKTVAVEAPKPSSSSTATVPPPATPVSSPVVVPTVSAQDDDAMQKSTQIFLQAARQHYDISFAQGCPVDVLAWEALYFSVWGHIKTLPPTENGQSMVPAPDENRVHSIRTLMSTGNDAQAVRSAALLAPASPFCLDLHCLLAEALGRLGAQFSGALGVVEQKTRAFVEKCLGIERVQFSDGTPFASDATLAWLESLTASQGACGHEDAVVGVINEARALAGQKQLAKALSLLHGARAHVGAADVLRLELTQVRLLVQNKAYAVVSPLAQRIVDFLDAHRLDDWDRELCMDALVVVYGVWAQSQPEKASAILERLAILDPARAFMLAAK